MTAYDDVGAFHRKFDLPAYPSNPPPRRLTTDELRFRGAFLLEELAEFFAAHGLIGPAARLIKEGSLLRSGYDGEPGLCDLYAAADALADLVWVALGTAHLMGLPFDEIWAEIKRANMEKERATGADDPRSKRGSALDVVKPDDWLPPDHVPALLKAGWGS